MEAQYPSPDVSLTIRGTKAKYAAPADWEHMKPVIKRLYIDEERTLSDVMAMMESQYLHRGT